MHRSFARVLHHHHHHHRRPPPYACYPEIFQSAGGTSMKPERPLLKLRRPVSTARLSPYSSLKMAIRLYRKKPWLVVLPCPTVLAHNYARSVRFACSSCVFPPTRSSIPTIILVDDREGNRKRSRYRFPEVVMKRGGLSVFLAACMCRSCPFETSTYIFFFVPRRFSFPPIFNNFVPRNSLGCQGWQSLTKRPRAANGSKTARASRSRRREEEATSFEVRLI